MVKRLPKLHHFYHVYCGNNADRQETWIKSVEYHVNALKSGGLIKKLDTTHIGLVGSQAQRDSVKAYLTDNAVPFEVVAEANDGWEQVTQNPLHAFAQENDGYILYAHTKGSFNDNYLNNTWRETMTYFNVLKWKDAVKNLEEYDAVGCYWYDDSGQSISVGYPHKGQRWFAGTFWWSKLDMLRQAPPVGMSSRWDAEVWIGKIPSNRILDLDLGRSAGCPIPESG